MVYQKCELFPEFDVIEHIICRQYRVISTCLSAMIAGCLPDHDYVGVSKLKSRLIKDKW